LSKETTFAKRLKITYVFLRVPHVSKSSLQHPGYLFNFKAKGVMGARKALISSFKVRVRIPYIRCYISYNPGGTRGQGQGGR